MSHMSVLRKSSGMIVHMLFIGIVSVYDAWLVVQLAEDILDHERNLVGQYLIRLTEGDVTLFVACKLIGTAGVLFTLGWLARYHEPIATPVVRSLTIFQAWLMWFLTFSVPADPRTLLAGALAVIAIVATCLWPLLAEQMGPRSVRRIRIRMTPQRLRRRPTRRLPLPANS